MLKKPEIYTGNKDSIFNKWFWSNWMATYKRIQIDPYLPPCKKLKFKYTNNLNIKPYTQNLIEEKVGKTLELIGTGEDILNRTLLIEALRSITNGTL